MKTKLITNGKVEILLVEGIPEIAKEVTITDKVKTADGKGKRITIGWKLREKTEFETTEDFLSCCTGFYQVLGLSGNWQFLSTIEDLTEEQAEGLIKIGVPGWEYWDYVNNRWGNGRFACIESFRSLLESNGVIFFNPKTTLIFIKNN